jgi:heptosyltransferase I
MPAVTSANIPDRNAPLRILIVRLGAIGDVLMTSPVAQALKEAYPNVHITWVVDPQPADFVRANPYVDEIFILERKVELKKMLGHWQVLSFLREIRQFGRELKAKKFDIAIDLQGLLKSGITTWLSGAPRRIGLVPSSEGNHFFMTETAPWPKPLTRLTQKYLAILAPFGIAQTPRKPVLQVTEEDITTSHALLTSRGIMDDRYIACCIATSRPQKDWVLSRWGELADILWESEGLRTVFLGGAEHRVDSLRLIEGHPSNPVTLVGNATLMQSAAIVQKAAMVIGGDTGMTYTGLVTNRPTVVLYGSTDPGWLAEEPSVAICFYPMPCSPCRTRPKCKKYDCMQAITVQDVADTASDLLRRCRVLSTAGCQ